MIFDASGFLAHRLCFAVGMRAPDGSQQFELAKKVSWSSLGSACQAAKHQHFANSRVQLGEIKAFDWLIAHQPPVAASHRLPSR